MTARSAVATWAEMIKFAHSIFALPFALVATFLAADPNLPTPMQVALIVLCMVAARSAAMTFNRLVDAKLDAGNPRTAGRPLPAGRISPAAARTFFVTSAGAFVAACAAFWPLTGNRWPLLLSVPVLAWLCFYSYTKRFTAWAHVVLGAGIAFSPVGAWIAIDPQTLGPPAWLLMGAVACWIAGFDLIYACQDVEFDRRAGLHSVPAKLGVDVALWLARGLHLLTVAALVAVGFAAELGGVYFVGVGCVAMLLIVENALVSPRDLSRVNLAFFTINGVVGVAFGILAIVDILFV